MAKVKHYYATADGLVTMKLDTSFVDESSIFVRTDVTCPGGQFYFGKNKTRMPLAFQKYVLFGKDNLSCLCVCCG